MKLHHLGYAVRDIEQSRRAFAALGYVSDGEVFPDVSRNCNILFMTAASGGADIELIATLDPALPSPVASMLRKSPSALYHPCYETDDLEAQISRLEALGYRVLREAASAPAIGARAKVAFLYEPSVGIIELAEAPVTLATAGGGLS